MKITSMEYATTINITVGKRDVWLKTGASCEVPPNKDHDAVFAELAAWVEDRLQEKIDEWTR